MEIYNLAVLEELRTFKNYSIPDNNLILYGRINRFYKTSFKLFPNLNIKDIWKKSKSY